MSEAEPGPPLILTPVPDGEVEGDDAAVEGAQDEVRRVDRLHDAAADHAGMRRGNGRGGQRERHQGGGDGQQTEHAHSHVSIVMDHRKPGVVRA